MSSPNLANKVNNLCGKIQKLNKRTAGVYLSAFISEFISEQNSNIQPILFPTVDTKNISYNTSTGSADILENGIYTVSINGEVVPSAQPMNNNLRVTVLLSLPADSMSPIDYTLEQITGTQNVRTVFSIPLRAESSVTITARNDTNNISMTISSLLWSIVKVSEL